MRVIPWKQVATIGSLVSLAFLPGRAVLSQTASFSGALTYIAPSGATTSISGQIVLPPGLFFSSGSNSTVSYTSTGTAGSNDFRPTSLTLTPGTVLRDSTLTVSTQVAQNLSQITNLTTNQANLAAYISIVRAAAGSIGLD
ncbi:MAG: hypothetical protein RMK91_02940 [Pseudanabaenaceae cyanobacterium SKYGB_i_bin29]|nr:hypothetical protein [Pseudanabaenaceae cyanobacterium SKYG29]MDW8420800.1 hypothetical protein [Pseudanabaenaceae cyanobacterium SKYGB_i_bin29]